MSGTVNNASSSSAIALGNLKQEMNIPEMLLAIQVERSSVLDDQIKGQMADMQKRNDWLKNANAAMAELRAQTPTNSTDTASWGTFTKTDGTSASVKDWCNANGITVPGTNDTGLQSEFQSTIDTAKSTIDSVNSQSQMDMVRLQGLMDKRNQAFDLMTNTLSKAGKSIDSITGNMR